MVCAAPVVAICDILGNYEMCQHSFPVFLFLLFLYGWEMVFRLTRTAETPETIMPSPFEFNSMKKGGRAIQRQRIM